MLVFFQEKNLLFVDFLNLKVHYVEFCGEMEQQTAPV